VKNVTEMTYVVSGGT